MYKGLIRKCKIMIVVSVSFIILTGLAMIAYPGGSLYDKVSIHYNFFENFFSDLGATVTVSGKKNTVSNILFISALGSIGLVMIYFSKIWRAVDVDVHKLSFLGYMSKICITISGLCFIGIAFTPWNIYYDYHLIFVKAAFGFLLLWTVLIIILQFGNQKIKALIIANIIYVVILSAYLYILFYGPKFGTEEGLEFQASAQKIIVYLSITNFIIQAAGIKRFLRIADFRKSGAKNFYV